MSERWAKLNELAGSADGAKFRRIAQGYTLDVLLSYANVQLRQLSQRYRLERVPDTLALQVIDQDMCDEIRTVHSLSGGESFLVSLALALGLSSLSSNRMKVESLFIDEGFGSLDAETLENRPITNSTQALQGTQGVYVNQAGAQPGADGATIRIRGQGTLNDNNPLILVDGIEFPLEAVNPNDIESISVLKDAASSAISCGEWRCLGKDKGGKER